MCRIYSYTITPGLLVRVKAVHDLMIILVEVEGRSIKGSNRGLLAVSQYFGFCSQANGTRPLRVPSSPAVFLLLPPLSRTTRKKKIEKKNKKVIPPREKNDTKKRRGATKVVEWRHQSCRMTVVTRKRASVTGAGPIHSILKPSN